MSAEDSGAEGYESVLCVKPDVKVFRLPPRQSNRAVRAADWQLESPDWSGRLRVVATGSQLWVRLEDKASGVLFARCPVDAHPGVAIEPVADSSRYFVLRIRDDSGRSAFVGVGFDDRSDAFDFNVAVQDHFKWLRQEEEAREAAKEMEAGPKLDLGFKEGQTIKININTRRTADSTDSGVGEVSTKSPRPAKKTLAAGADGAGGLGLLPPPPSSGRNSHSRGGSGGGTSGSSGAGSGNQPDLLGSLG